MGRQSDEAIAFRVGNEEITNTYKMTYKINVYKQSSSCKTSENTGEQRRG
ncbi:MAG: hypothetical protein LBS34_01990 [Rickettsiales bacterium]|nr:hypothetical protein [Rickettsiales bacterium]